MTPAEHYAAAEKLLDIADRFAAENDVTTDLAMAQVHATLAAVPHDVYLIADQQQRAGAA